MMVNRITHLYTLDFNFTGDYSVFSNDSTFQFTEFHPVSCSVC